MNATSTIGAGAPSVGSGTSGKTRMTNDETRMAGRLAVVGRRVPRFVIRPSPRHLLPRHLSSVPILIPALLGLAAALVGCQTAQLTGPLAPKLAGNDTDSQMAFWHTMALRSTVSNDEALHGLLLYLDGKDDAGDYAQRVEQLKLRGLLKAGFDRPAAEAVSRGTLATALVGALQIKGGLILRVLGPNPRYAVRELQYVGIYPRSSPNQTFSGSQYVAVIGRAEDYARSQSLDRPEAPLPDQVDAAAAPQDG